MFTTKTSVIPIWPLVTILKEHTLVFVLLVIKVMDLAVPVVKILMNVLQEPTLVTITPVAQTILVHSPVNVTLAGQTLLIPPNLDSLA